MTGHAPVPSEVEAKLLVPRARDLRAIAALKQLGTHPLRARDSARLHSLYVDTVDMTLARHGVALRLRQQGSRWEATAKWAGRVDETVHERPELTVDLSAPPALPFVLPEGPLHTHLAALVAGRPLLPILITDIHRRRVDVLATEDDGDESLAELALDRVHLRSPRNPTADAAYYEVEIEQLHGQRRQIAELARQLQRQFKLAPSPDSKFARGLKLLYGGAGLVATEPRVLASDTVEQAARSVVGRHLRRLREHDPGTRIGQEPEALHDMRVATRRLRAAVRIFAAGLPARVERGLRDELRWLGRLLGGVRDLDVQLEHLAAFAVQAPPTARAGLAGFDDYLVAERLRRRAPMLEGLDSPRYFRLLVRLEDFAAGRVRLGKRSAVAHTPVAVIGRRAIKKAFRGLLKRGDEIGAAPTPEDLHVLRIRAKRLRYLFEFLIDAVGKEGGRFVKRLTRLQDLLGTYHDAVVAGDYVRLYVERPGVELDAEQWRALMALAVSQSRLAEDMRGRFRRAWERFSGARTVKDCRAALRHLKRAPVANGAVRT